MSRVSCRLVVRPGTNGGSQRPRPRRDRQVDALHTPSATGGRDVTCDCARVSIFGRWRSLRRRCPFSEWTPERSENNSSLF